MTEVTSALFGGCETERNHPRVNYEDLIQRGMEADYPEHCLSASVITSTLTSILSQIGDRHYKHEETRSKEERDFYRNFHNGPLDADSAQYNSPGEVNPAWSSYPGTGNSFLVVHTLPTSHTSVQMEADGVFSPARFCLQLFPPSVTGLSALVQPLPPRVGEGSRAITPT